MYMHVALCVMQQVRTLEVRGGGCGTFTIFVTLKLTIRFLQNICNQALTTAYIMLLGGNHQGFVTIRYEYGPGYDTLMFKFNLLDNQLQSSMV